MTQSPFPGMDPYMEQDWLDVQTALTTYACDQIQEQLPAELCARISAREMTEQAGGEPATQRFIEIFELPTRSRVVTTIELVSPTNKRPGEGHELYVAKREECLAAGVNVVEIDLSRGGDRLLILPALAKARPLPACIACVRPASRPGEMAVYRLPLDQPLKPIRIPLRAHDEDVVLHLQPLVAQAYSRGRYDRLDYSRPLDPPLGPEDAAFAVQALKAAGK